MKIGKFLVQTPHGTWPTCETEPRCNGFPSTKFQSKSI